MFDSGLDSEQLFGQHLPMSRTYVRRRRVAATVATVVVALGLLGPVSQAFAGPGGMEPVAQRSYVVRSGDTLWAIAGSVAPGSDPREIVEQILSANQVDPGSLSPGQVLTVPHRG
jgi:nucleoid-associated protein YgaU